MQAELLSGGEGIFKGKDGRSFANIPLFACHPEPQAKDPRLLFVTA